MSQTEGGLSDPEDIYFLSHFELGELCHKRGGRRWGEVTRERKEVFGWVEGLGYSPLSKGGSVPVRWEGGVERGKGEREEGKGKVWKGMPVCFFCLFVYLFIRLFVYLFISFLFLYFFISLFLYFFISFPNKGLPWSHHCPSMRHPFLA